MQKPLILNKNSGFVLLEALIAIAIFSFALLGLIGLQAVSIKNVSDAKYRADAAYFTNQIIAQMWADRANLSDANYGYRAAAVNACDTSTDVPPARLTAWVADMANVLPGVSTAGTSSLKPKIVIDATPGTSIKATVTVCWKLPNDTQSHNHVATAQINI